MTSKCFSSVLAQSQPGYISYLASLRSFLSYLSFPSFRSFLKHLSKSRVRPILVNLALLCLLRHADLVLG